MKVLSLNLSKEGLALQDSDNVSSQELASRVIKNIILGWGNQAKQGEVRFSEDNRRKFYKISDALDTAVKANAEFVELEDDWFGLLKTAKREVSMSPNDLIRRVEDLIDQVKDR